MQHDFELKIANVQLEISKEQAKASLKQIDLRKMVG